MANLNISRFQGFRAVKPQTLPKVLYPSEVMKLLECCDPVEYVMMEFYIRTGLRPSEGCHVRVKDINLDERTVFVVEGKRKKDRIVPFDMTLKSILTDFIKQYRLRSDDYLFSVKKDRGRPCKGKIIYHKKSAPYSRGSIGVILHHLADKAGIQEREPVVGLKNHHIYRYRVHPHLLRHTALTMIQESCGDPFVTMEIAGHSNIQMTQIYVHLALSRKRAVVDEAFKIIDKPKKEVIDCGRRD